MKPGPELDALVAEKVMGLKPVQRAIPHVYAEYTYVTEWLNEDGPNGIWGKPESRPLRNYSTDISAAWEVVEKLWKDPEYFASFQITNIGAGGAIFCCVGNGEAFADTAPHAICLAALKAIGYSESGG